MELQSFFHEHPKAALGFSGGVDSSYLLYAGLHCGADVRPYFVKTPFQPRFELDDAQRLAGQLGAKLCIIEADVLCDARIAANTAERCYYCKQLIFERIQKQAQADGYTLLIDGSNASDDADDRPGMRALAEMKVRSPLREAGLIKAEVRRLSQEAGLFTWDKPAYACLATRVPTDRAITAELLAKVERAEDYLSSLGFRDFRVRLLDDMARLQLPEPQMVQLLEQREEIMAALSDEFKGVLLDLAAR